MECMLLWLLQFLSALSRQLVLDLLAKRDVRRPVQEDLKLSCGVTSEPKGQHKAVPRRDTLD